MSRIKRTTIAAAASLAAFGIAPAHAGTGDLTVLVSGASDNSGEVGCALYSGVDGFPMDTSKARQMWQAPQEGGARCHFQGLAPGTYAIAISYDVNGNRQTDTNSFGIPVEAWGVSNNARPTPRPPRFDEAAFDVADGAETELRIEIAK